MDMNEYKHRLFNKLLEETQEVIDAVTQDDVREEIADVLEVIMAIADAHQIQWNDIIYTANQKRLDKGGFDEQIYVNYVDVDNASSQDTYYQKYPHKYNCSDVIFTEQQSQPLAPETQQHL
jgi:predicted house-cleaning noncanonical NTP pyrophosphatase (MazG superfamily)